MRDAVRCGAVRETILASSTTSFGPSDGRAFSQNDFLIRERRRLLTRPVKALVFLLGPRTVKWDLVAMTPR